MILKNGFRLYFYLCYNKDCDSKVLLERGVKNMEQLLGVLSWYEIMFAAVSAYLLTFFIMRIQKMRSILKKRDNLSVDYKLMDLASVMSKCKELFPIDTIYFHGKVFRRGMRVKITTIQKKVIEGELIGKNKVDLVCVRTSNHIVAHEIDKIEEISILEGLEE